jgi:hypothetical protein
VYIDILSICTPFGIYILDARGQILFVDLIKVISGPNSTDKQENDTSLFLCMSVVDKKLVALVSDKRRFIL